MCRTWINPFINMNFKYFYDEVFISELLKEKYKFHKKEEPDKAKVKVLEKIVKAIYGRQNSKIKYNNLSDECLLPQVKIECDIDDALKTLCNLKIANIDFEFFENVRKTKERDRWYSKEYESYVEICLYIERDYYNEIESLKKELKITKQKLKKYEHK